eukprot:SAG31_NODE_5300_length_2622_cov_40.288942_4_plen_70_part_00
MIVLKYTIFIYAVQLGSHSTYTLPEMSCAAAVEPRECSARALRRLGLSEACMRAAVAPLEGHSHRCRWR